ncbi:MAG: phosphatase PAP2 family protein [Bacteroidota bacterium]
MLDLLKTNTYYFLLCLLFLIVGGIGLSQIQTGDFLIWFSENRSIHLDSFFSFTTRLGEQYAYFVFVILALFYRFRLVLIIPLTAVIVLLIALVLKEIFAHPRPSVFFYDQLVQGQLQTVDGIHLLTGYSSFPSGHTLSAFTLYTLIALFFPKKKLMAFFFFSFALFIGLSRVYLVQHFLKDIYVGGLLGILLASTIYLFQQRWLPQQPTHWINRNLLSLRKN